MVGLRSPRHAPSPDLPITLADSSDDAASAAPSVAVDVDVVADRALHDELTGLGAEVDVEALPASPSLRAARVIHTADIAIKASRRLTINT